MKTPSELKKAAADRNGAPPAIASRPVSRAPRGGSECYWLERDKTAHAHTYSVFRFRTLPDGLGEITLVLDGALYSAARESVLRHTVEESAKAVEREYLETE